MFTNEKKKTRVEILKLESKEKNAGRVEKKKKYLSRERENAGQLCCLHFTETRLRSKIVVCWLPNIADFVTQTCHARTDKHYKNYSKTLASTSSGQGNNYSRHEPNMFLTRTPRYTRTKSNFPWISPRFSVIFTRLTRTRKTRTKFPFPSSKFP